MLAGGVNDCISTVMTKYGDVKKKNGTKGRSPLDPENFVEFKLKKVERYNHNTAKFFFELPNNEASLLPVASCVIVKASDPEALKDSNGNPIIRPYTPISASDAKGELVFIIKRYEAGNASKYIHSLKPGDTLSIKGPFPKWPYKVNEYEEVALVGGGSGIAPLYQVLTHALSAPNNRTKFTLLFSNVTEADILLREEFDALKEKYPSNLDVIYVLDAPPKGWTGPSGYISKELIQKHISPPSDKLKVFICGPPPQVASLAGQKDGMKQGELGGIFKELGYTEDQVFKF
ncbi:cytochrome-b5 reductase [Mycena floridula]|nr:cytochrome-b5 reductase [Mycena floridula]